MRKTVVYSIFFLIICSLLPLVSADTEVVTAGDWTSSQTITSETNAYGTFDDSTATFGTFSSDGQVATAIIDNPSTASGTLNSVSFQIRMSTTGTLSNDYVDIQYSDNNGATWTSVATNIQPGTALTTYTTPAYSAPLVTTFAEVDAMQVRILYERVAGSDAGVFNIDGVEVTVDYTPADNTPPTISFNNPANNTWDTDGTVQFQFTPTDSSGIDNCSLYLGGVFNLTNTSITNATINYITQSFADGTYLWSVQCIDSSANNNANFTTGNRTINIDTTPPEVYLESPENNNITAESLVTYAYNVTDIATTITSCEIIINDSIQDTDFSITESTTQTFAFSLANGFYEWWVNCTDANGFETESARRNITINTTSPSVVSDFPSYELSDTVVLDGENFNNIVSITTNYTLPNGSVLTNTTTTTASGTFNTTLFLNYSFPSGTYTVFSYQTNDIFENASTSFSVTLPLTQITVTAPSYMQGDEIEIIGEEFPPSTSVNITLTFNDSSTDSFLTATNSTGGFTTYYNLSYTASLQFTNVSATSVSFPQFNASDNFSITQRFGVLTTDLSLYARDTNVNIFGYNFTRLGIIELLLFDNVTNATASGFPTNKTANTLGDFTHIWNSGDTCNGVYAVQAIDQNRSILNDTVYFNISEFTTQETISLPIGGAKEVSPTRQTITVSNINLSDGTDESLTSNSKVVWYYEINFTNALNPTLQISSVSFQIEHENTGTFNPPTLEYWNGTGYALVGCAGLTMATPEHNDTCILTSQFPTATSLSDVSLRVSAEKTSGPSATWTVDYAHLNITSQYQPACTYLNGTPGGGLAENPPFITSLLIEDDILSPTNELDLNAGTTKFVTCNVTVEDNDGAASILGVNATLFSNTVSLGSADDNRTHYTNSTCTQISAVSTQANYSCGFSVYYYAINGTWTCSATARDDIDVGTQTNTSTLNPLYALNISTTLIDYGTFEAGQISTEQPTNVSNIGNRRINVSAYGYGSTPGDNLSLNCTQNNITVNATRYALSQGVAFNSKTQLNGTLTPLDLTIDEQTTPIGIQRNETFWQLAAPGDQSPQGICNGTIVFQAELG